MTFAVGDQARPFSIRHAPGSDVRFALLLTDETGATTSLPTGAVVELIVDGLAAPLAGAVTAGRVDWDIQSEAFDGLPKEVAAAAVWYRNGTWDGRWFAGSYLRTTGFVSSVSVPGTVVVSTDGVQLLTVALSAGIPGAAGATGDTGPAGGVASVDGLTGVVTLPADGAAATATKRTLGTGALQAAAGNDSRFSGAVGGRYRLADYGTVDLTGATDSSTAFLACLAACQATGGAMDLPGGIVRVDSQVVFSNDGTAQPRQKPVHWVGSGGTQHGASTQALPLLGGTVLDLRYTGGGSNLAKIDTRGLGLLHLSGLTLTDLGTSSNPFVHTTNTTIVTEPGTVAVIGNSTKATTTCDQDAFILGGTDIGLPVDGAYESPFQGYGTRIEGVYFNRIRRGVLAQTYGNALIIKGNTWWATCGSNVGGSAAAIEFKPTGGNSCVGGDVSGNLIECVGYTYGVLAEYTTRVNFEKNMFFDAGVLVACYRFNVGAGQNRVTTGLGPAAVPMVSEAPAVALTNTVITDEASLLSRHSGPQGFHDVLYAMGPGNNGLGLRSLGDSGDQALIVPIPSIWPYPTLALQTITAEQITTGVLTSGSQIVTATTGTWTVGHIGLPIKATGIPVGATIVAVDSATSITISQAATATATGVTLRYASFSTPQVRQISFNRQHITPAGVIGSAGPYAAAGAGATFTAVGTDTAFTATLTTGTATSAGQQTYCGWAAGWINGAPRLQLTAKNAAAAAQMTNVYPTANTANSFLQAIAALPASTTFIWDVVAIQ